MEANNILNLISYSGVTKFKSIRRAMRRGLVSTTGVIYPKRPFNNRSRNKGTRPLELRKEAIYGQLKHRQAS